MTNLAQNQRCNKMLPSVGRNRDHWEQIRETQYEISVSDGKLRSYEIPNAT